MGRHLLTPNTPVHLAHTREDETEKDWPASAPRSSFHVANLTTSRRSRRMATDYNLRARQLLRYAAADPAQPHADTVTDEHLRRARFLQPLYDPAVDEEGDEIEERWPMQWVQSVKSLRGFVTCRPWKDATEGYVAQEKGEDEENAEKEDEAGGQDVAAEERPSAEPAPGPEQPSNEAARAAADLLNLMSLGGKDTILPQTTSDKPAPSSGRDSRYAQAQAQTQTQTLTQQTQQGGSSRLPASLTGAKPSEAGGAAKPMTGLADGRDTGSAGPFEFPPLRETGRNTATTSLHPPLGETGHVTADLPGAFPTFGETQDTPAPLFSTSPNGNNLFGPGSGGRGRPRSRSVSPRGGSSSNHVTGGEDGFTDEEMERFRAWVVREGRKKAREAGGK